MAGLAQLARDQWFVFPSFVAIAFCSCYFSRASASSPEVEVFLSVPAGALFRALRSLFFFRASQRRTQERLSLCNETELIALLAERIYQHGDTGETVLTYDPIYNAVMFFYNIVSELRRAVFG